MNPWWNIDAAKLSGLHDSDFADEPNNRERSPMSQEQSVHAYDSRLGSGDLATVGDITAAYRILLRREPDPGGFALYKAHVERGTPLAKLISFFTISDEYRRSVAAEKDVVYVDLGGYVVCVRPTEEDIGRTIVESRDFEPHVRNAIKDLLREGQTFVDIGANVGAVALMGAKIVGERGTVVAVEPNPDNVQLLYAGILQNGFTNTRVIPNAASDRRTIFALKGGTSNAYVAPAASRLDGIAYAQSVILDEVLATLPAIHVVKIDIEGHEPVALKGFAKLLRKHKPALVAEFAPHCLRFNQGIDPRDYLELLLSHYSRLKVISLFGDSTTFTKAGDVMDYWKKRNREVTEQKLLLDGVLHFDIIATHG